jgi:hypothetical protein
MYGLTRGTITLLGAAVAGLLVWLATQINDGSTGGYWAVYGLIAAAGLTMALSQLFGGWTKWGVPRLSINVFLLAFIPVLVAAGWVILFKQPHGNWFRDHVRTWSNDASIDGLVRDLGEYISVLAFGIGLVFGFCFDTSGRAQSGPRGRRRRAAAVPAGDSTRPPQDRPTTREPAASERETERERERDRAPARSE